MGQIFRDRYEVVELIGEGGMARVYRGVDRRLSRPVVLKVLKDDLVNNEEFRQRFAREASNAARLSHSNIIKVHDVDEENGKPFIVMEFYPAQDLKSILKKVGKLSIDRAVKVAEDILDALDYAHAQGIVHRDLKPHNVLITDRNEVKITDFGIAKALASDSLTRTGSMIGTAQYMSPEQAQGQDVGPQSDVYSLGVMLYEMLCGRLPFEGDNLIAVAIKHVQETPPPLATRGTAIPQALEDVVMTALRKNPAERYRDAQSFRRALVTATEQVARPNHGNGPSNGLNGGHAADASNGSAGWARVDETIVRPAVPRASGEAPVLPAYSLADSGEFQTAPTPPEPVEPPSGRRAAIILLLTTICLAGMAYAAYRIYNDSTSKVVPGIVGMLEEEARKTVEGNGLTLTVKEFVYSDDPPGTVKSQDPPVNTVVVPPRTVLVVISKGHQTVQVPQLLGLDRLAAQQALEERGLKAKFHEQYNDTVQAGHVATQDPESGTAVEFRALVTVTISKGLPQVVVPSLLGASQKDAVAKAEKAGLRASTLTQKSSATVPKGNVLEQTPKAGTKTNRGGVIQIVVSSGPESRPVPSLKGLTLADARRNAQQQGFTVVVDEGGDHPDARVVQQNPEGGAALDQGSAIHVSLEPPEPTPEASPSVSEEETRMPGVTHLNEHDARQVLEEHGLQVFVKYDADSDAPSGTVTRQIPEEGVSLRRGASVELTVSSARPKQDEGPSR